MPRKVCVSAFQKLGSILISAEGKFIAKAVQTQTCLGGRTVEIGFRVDTYAFLVVVSNQRCNLLNGLGDIRRH